MLALKNARKMLGKESDCSQSIKSPGLSECLLGDFRGLFLDIVFNDILTMQRFLDISRLLHSGGWQVC